MKLTLQIPRPPVIQIALDYATIEEALAMAKIGIEAGVDWLEIGTPLIAITGRAASKLGLASNIVIDLGPLQEACSLGLAPSTSTTAMLAIGDALALVASRMRGFSRDDFARFHPGGSLGRQLARVDEYMRRLNDCRVTACSRVLREVLIAAWLSSY